MALVLVSFILFSFIPTIGATSIVVVPDDNETIPTPIAFWNNTKNYQLPLDMCVSNSGITFSVNAEQDVLSQSFYIHSSFVAWNENGSVRWVKESITRGGLKLQAVATDDLYVYATGDYPVELISKGPFLAKYDFQGNEIWNTTWNLRGYGQDIIVAEDGTIVVSGYAGNSTVGFFIIAFDTNGNELWCEMVQGSNIPSLAHSSNHIYILSDRNIRRYQTDGDLVWSTNENEGNKVYARGDSLYTLNVSWWTHIPTLPILHEPVQVTRWDMMNGRPLWTQTIGIYDANQQLCNNSGFDCAIDQDGSFVLLMDAQQRESWYYLRILKDGTGFSSSVLLDNEWRVAFVDVEESGVIHIVGYGRSSKLAIAIYDPVFLKNPILMGIDLPLVGAVVAGVALFNIGFILYLKKKHPS